MEPKSRFQDLSFGAPQGALGAHWEALGAPLEAFSGPWGSLGEPLRLCWASLETRLLPLAAFWKPLGAFWSIFTSFCKLFFSVILHNHLFWLPSVRLLSIYCTHFEAAPESLLAALSARRGPGGHA